MRKTSLLAIAAFGAAVGMFAQAGPQYGPPMAQRGFAGPGPMGMGMDRGKVVLGLPYTADVSNSVVQTLADGNTISRTTAGHVARDSQGRTYMKEDISGGPWAQKTGSTMTFISDPVAGYAYVLDAERKVAVRREFKPRNADHSLMRPDGAGPFSPDAKDRVESDLGSQQINGVTAAGKSVTRTIPAGAIGNAQPIVAKTEIWTSPDLQVVVLSKRNDPRMGQSTYSLNNIQRVEPNAALFQIPSDYTVQDAPAFPKRPDAR
ncbi:MAG: hypothetical protein M3Y72_11855 [Acidobacteriota bacterium]|nr:hypothetical protein [Acidobacteriota bacterium]MDQ2841710.1 hypothetical protein [Acidobacteriota bacterium]